jgi:recombinational DNA repair ATPase RecF
MIIKSFSAAGFRNIEKCTISFKNGLNLLHGKNAQGLKVVLVSAFWTYRV